MRRSWIPQDHSKLWHDDIRRPPDETWFWARTNQDAVRYLLASDCKEASLDHDLGLHDVEPDEFPPCRDPAFPSERQATYLLKGNSPDGDGVDLVKAMLCLRLVPPKVTIHSWNPEGANYMAGLLSSLSGAEVVVRPFEVPDAT